MSDLIQAVKNGVVQPNESTVTQKKSGSALDKDAFLQLLTTQMKYQDPLNPSSNTEYVAQLATFSQLEQMQNLSNTTSNSQAFNLVGKNVIVKNVDNAGNTSYVNGVVDFVNITGGKAQMSIGGKFYTLDKLDTIIDDQFIRNQNLPGVTDATKIKYDGEKPTDLSFKVNLGSGDTKADDVAIAINGYLVDAKYVKLSGDTVKIDKAAFKDLTNGTYKITVAFNDSEYTVIRDKVTLEVQNAVTSDDTPPPADGDDKTDGGDKTGGDDSTGGSGTA